MEKLPIAPTPDTKAVYKVWYVALVDGQLEENDGEFGTRIVLPEEDEAREAELSMRRLYEHEGRNVEKLKIITVNLVSKVD